jgi:DNA mismatch repair protein MutS
LGFKSIIYGGHGGKGAPEMESYVFKDMALEYIFAEIKRHVHDDEIESLLYMPLTSEEEIQYRQEVFQDLANINICSGIQSFSDSAGKLQYDMGKMQEMGSVQRNRLFLDSAYLYCNSVISLLDCLNNNPVKSRGLNDLKEYLKSYTESDAFSMLISESSEIENLMKSLRYMITIKGTKITVRRNIESSDFGNEIIEFFTRFLDGKRLGFREKHSYSTGHVEASLVELASRLYPDQFSRMESFSDRHQNFIDPVIERLMHEIKFYTGYLAYMSGFMDRGLKFCVPGIITSGGASYSKDSYDLALAGKLLERGMVPVTNSFYIGEGSRIIIVTGPNNGGKTTFARTFGQLHYLASLGFPVPGTSARLQVPDKIYTHFEKTETVENPVGRLEEELIRLHTILEYATYKSIVIINEMLSSATLKDGIEIGKRVIENLKEIGCITVYVTFINELASIDGIESYVAQIDSRDPGRRTYKIIKQPSDGMAYAHALAEKYRLSYKDLMRRIDNENVSDQH